MKRIAVMVSGRGSNLQALIDAAAAGTLGASIALVLSDQPDAPALDRARAAGLETRVLTPPPRSADEGAKRAYDQTLLATLQDAQIDFIVLAGYMRLLSGTVIAAYRWRIINVHPSLLPAFPGMHAVRQALAAGVKVAGCTVHFVDEGVDTGPILFQQAVPVFDDDDEASLHARIREWEHRLLPQAVRVLAAGAWRLDGRRVRIDPAYRCEAPAGTPAGEA